MYTSNLLRIILIVTLSACPTSATIILSQFQTVAGFPQSCQDAYDTPIAGCDSSEFPQNCSEQCLFALAQAQAMIDNACAGQQAPFDSIIGQMFKGDGPQFMCTENFDQGSSASSSSSYYSDSASSSLSSTTTSSILSAAASSTTETTTTTAESSSSSKSTARLTLTTSSTIHRTSTFLAPSSTTTSEVSTSSSTSASIASASASASAKVFVTTAFNNGAATVLTSEAQRTSAASSNPDAFGGGGSPFEVGPNGNGAAGQVNSGAGAALRLLSLSVMFGMVLVP